jgi:hypothetical protein
VRTKGAASVAAAAPAVVVINLRRVNGCLIIVASQIPDFVAARCGR